MPGTPARPREVCILPLAQDRRNDSHSRGEVSTGYVTCLRAQSSSAEARKTPRSPSLPPTPEYRRMTKILHSQEVRNDGSTEAVGTHRKSQSKRTDISSHLAGRQRVHRK